MIAAMRIPTRLMLGALVVLSACAPEPSTTPAASIVARPSPSVAAPTPSPEATASPRPSVWAELTVSGGPAAREDHTWTVAANTATAYLFGGRNGATVYGDLWAYDLATDAWAELAPSGAGPAARFGHEAEWVEGIGLVVFAGQAGTSFFNDLWAFDPETAVWRQLPASGDLPPARYGTCADIGPDGRLWISHGFTSDFGRFADTRAYDFATGSWTDETRDGPTPVNRCLHGCWWTDADDFVLYAGQTTGVVAMDDLWARGADDDWRQAGGDLPAARNLYAYARTDAGTWVFGGLGLDGAYLGDLYLVDDALLPQPAELDAPGGPPGRAGAELVWDADRARLLLFGGLYSDGALADLWELPVAAPLGAQPAHSGA